MYKTLLKNKASKKLMISIVVIGQISWIHHIYGGIIYDTAYRIIAPTISLPLLMILTFYLQYRLLIKATKVLKFVYISMVSLVWIGLIGLVEGFYNHILKNILYFTDTSKSVLNSMFPPEFGELSLFETPNDIFFEATGIIQFLLAILLSYNLIRFLKSLQNNESKHSLS